MSFDTPRHDEGNLQTEIVYSILDNAPSQEGVDWLFGLMSHHGYVHQDKLSPLRLQNLERIVDLALDDERAALNISTTVEMLGQKHTVNETFADKLSSLKSKIKSQTG